MELTTDAITRDNKGESFFDPRYTCDFDNSSPELRWTDVPEGTAGFVVIAEDPDASKNVNGQIEPFTHWVVYNIPAGLLHLPAGIPPQESLPNGIRQGLNSFGKLGYGGPCPPANDRAHRYVFRIYAVRAVPDLAPRATRQQLLAAIQAVVIQTAEVTGRYQRMVQKAG